MEEKIAFLVLFHVSGGCFCVLKFNRRAAEVAVVGRAP
jgi:hypothetical protein